MIQNILTGFLIGLGVGGGGVLMYVERRNKGFERYIQQLTNERNQLQGAYDELARQSKNKPKVTPVQLTPMMTYIGPEDDGRSQMYERFGGPEQ